MSKLSIYEDPWINMVFEGKNQQYGAYQLRHDSNKTMLFAFLAGLLLVCSFAIVPVLIKNFTSETIIKVTPIFSCNMFRIKNCIMYTHTQTI